jgi:2'-5' RNA ligase
VSLVALDVALLPPPHVRDLAVRLSRALPRESFKGLRLDERHLPHITLTQQFVPERELESALDRVGAVLAGMRPLPLHVPGAGKARSTVWIAIDRSPSLLDLHERLMAALLPFEREGGSPSAFVDGDARPGDVQWVSGYRRSSAFAAYTPHITLGHATAPPSIAPFDFEADVVAACHLGRFCTCRKVIRSWTL